MHHCMNTGGNVHQKNEKNLELLFEKQNRPTKSFHWGIVQQARQ